MKPRSRAPLVFGPEKIPQKPSRRTATVYLRGSQSERWRRYASAFLIGAGILIPSGFFLGGIFIHAGDPDLGIALVPVGAVLLLLAILLTSI